METAHRRGSKIVYKIFCVLKNKLVLHQQNRQLQRGVTGGKIGIVKPDVELANSSFFIKSTLLKYTVLISSKETIRWMTQNNI